MSSEPPFVRMDSTATLLPGMVLSVEAYIRDKNAGTKSRSRPHSTTASRNSGTSPSSVDQTMS